MGDSKVRITRRGLLVGAGTLVACSSESSRGTLTDAGVDASPMPDGGANLGDAGAADANVASSVDRVLATWREVLASAEARADHLPARAEALVAAKDVDGIVALVRDRIRTVPFSRTAMGTRRLAWGVRGTLRAGAGSLWDKSETLADLLTRAGATVEKLEGRTQASATWTRDHLFPKLADVPSTLTDERASALRAELGLAAIMPRPDVDRDDTKTSALVAAMQSKLVGVPALVPFPANEPDTVPILRVTSGGRTFLVDVAESGLPVDQTKTQGSLLPSTPTAQSESVEVSLLAVDSTRPGSSNVLVSGRYARTDLVGRTLFVQTLPAGAFASLYRTPLRDVSRFFAVLALRGHDVAEADRERFTTVGKAFDVSGRTLDTANGTVNVRGGAVTGDAPDAAAVARTTSLTVRTSAAFFPQIDVSVEAKDGSDLPVTGLGSGFTIREGGTTKPFTVLENQRVPLRILFVVDRSTSLPAEFRGTAQADFVSGVATAIQSEFPTASFRVASVGGPRNEARWTTSPADVRAQVLAATGGSSDLWRALVETNDASPSVVVLLTDGNSTDRITDVLASQISEVAPMLALAVGSGPLGELTRMAELTSGVVSSVATTAAAETSARDFVRARERVFYKFRYLAASDGPALRDVDVALRDRPSVTARAQYRVVEPASRVAPSRLAGLVLRVQIGTDLPVDRLISGTLQPGPTTPESVFEEVHASLFGVSELHFEGEPPPFSVRLAEATRSRLSLEPALRAVAAKDGKGALEAMQRGTSIGFAEARELLARTWKGEEGVFASGLRAALVTGYTRFDRHTVKRADILPLGPLFSVHGDAALARDAAMRASVRQALVESARFTVSAEKSLRDQDLALLRPSEAMTTVIPDLSSAEQLAWRTLLSRYDRYHRLVPKSRTPTAFWAMDRDTGAVLAVLPDGSGGGTSVSGTPCGAGGAGNVVDGASLVANVLGMMGFLSTGVAGWVGLTIVALRKLVAATIILDLGLPVTPESPSVTPGSSDVPNLGDDALSSLGSALVGAAIGSFGRPGEIAGELLGAYEGATSVGNDAGSLLGGGGC
ncbi:MAG: vWA domain-containing protein [Polyangiaceae bacterium]